MWHSPHTGTHHLGSSRHDAAQRRPHSTRPHPRADFQGRFPADRGLRIRAFAALQAGSRGRGAAGHGARRRGPRSELGLAWSLLPTITGSIGSRSPTGSSRRSSIKAATVGATFGGSHSSTAADPYRGRRPSNDFATPQDSRGPRRGSPGRTLTARPISLSEA